MPYIKKERRDLFDKNLHNISMSFKLDTWEGDLNYCINLLCKDILSNFGTNYKNINAVVGALECAKLEIYRRVCAPYEDTKIIENGDV